MTCWCIQKLQTHYKTIMLKLALITLVVTNAVSLRKELLFQRFQSGQGMDQCQ